MTPAEIADRLLTDIPRDQRVQYVRDHEDELSLAKPHELARIASILLKESTDEAKIASPVIGDRPKSEYEPEILSLEEYYVENPL